MTSPVTWFARRSLVTRLLATQAVVLVAGLAVCSIVALLVAPPLFHDHLLQAGASAQSPELDHVENAFTSANLIALAVALVTALLIALAVSLYLTRRIRRPLTALAHAAGDVAQGRYTRVHVSGIGSEFDQLAVAFNQMADRLNSVEDTRRRLLSDLAHEMRTPVTTIEGYLEGLEDGVVTWNAHTADVMQDQTGRLIRLIKDIDDVSRAEEGRMRLEPAATPVPDLVWTAYAAARDQYARKGVNLLADPGAGAGTYVRVDPQRMGQVLANLLTNALRHTPAGGTVQLNAAPATTTVLITVTDNGDGIPSDCIPHIFERFYRGDTARDREHGGTGIGLTISRAIVEAHDGRLTGHSGGTGQGAQFRIELPTCAASAGLSQPDLAQPRTTPAPQPLPRPARSTSPR